MGVVLKSDKPCPHCGKKPSDPVGRWGLGGTSRPPSNWGSLEVRALPEKTKTPEPDPQQGGGLQRSRHSSLRARFNAFWAGGWFRGLVGWLTAIFLLTLMLLPAMVLSTFLWWLGVGKW